MPCEAGGLSGLPLQTLSNAMLARAFLLARGRLVLIGAGGVFTGRDALTKLQAGASLVQLYSSFAFHGPALIPRLKAELLTALRDARFCHGAKCGRDSREGIGGLMQHFSRFAPLAERYDGFVLDLWGVIHDGVNAFPHAVDTLRHLRDAGKRTLLLSNVPRPNDAAQTMMRRMGIEDALYTGILTSGEAVRRALLDPPDLWWTELGVRVFHLGPDRDKPVLQGLPLTVVATPRRSGLRAEHRAG